VDVIRRMRDASEPAGVCACAPPGSLERRGRLGSTVMRAAALHGCDEHDGYQGHKGDSCKN
jgi:hypothetical protein